MGQFRLVERVVPFPHLAFPKRAVRIGHGHGTGAGTCTISLSVPGGFRGFDQEFQFVAGVRGRRGRQVKQHCAHRIGGGRGFFRNHIVRMGGVSQKLRTLGPQLGDLHQNLAVRTPAPLKGCLVQAGAGRRQLQGSLLLLHGGQPQRDHVTGLSQGLGVFGRGGDAPLVEALEFVAFECHDQPRGFFPQVVGELFGQHAQPFVELGQPLFVLGVEGGAVPAELPQDMVVESPGFGVVGWGDGRDPPIELLVQV